MNFTAELKQVSSKKTCTAQECVRSSRTAKSSYCDMHYQRMRKHGTLDKLRVRHVDVDNCTVDGCKNITKSSQLCAKHYYRFTKHGSPLKFASSQGQGETLEQRFWSRVQIKGVEECWPWLGKKNRNDYGFCNIEGLRHSHRVAAYFHFGAYPKSKHIMHKCDNPICCNPNHLQIGTRELNLQDKIEKQRQAKGSTHGKAKLDEKLVVNLREKYNSGYTIRELLPSARGVSYRVLWCALVGRTWRHI